MTPYFGLAPDIRVYESLSIEQKCQRGICTLATLAIYTLADTYYVLGKISIFVELKSVALWLNVKFSSSLHMYSHPDYTFRENS